MQRRKRSFFSTYTSILIVANIAVFLIINFISLILKKSFIPFIALMPSNILSGKYLWTIIASMFMHAGVWHLFANMVSLSFIGGFVEKLIGKKRFIALYFAGGIFASLIFIAISAVTGIDFNVYAVGASGAIFALGGLLAVLTPKLPVMVFFLLPLPMWAAMIFLMFGLWALSLGLGLPIGNTAHLGGLLIGVAYGFYLRKKYPNKTRMISRYFSK